MNAPRVPAPQDPLRLTRALCHEMGNLLAAVRLSAYLVVREREWEGVVEGARDVDLAAAQAAASLALLPPLLAPSEKSPAAVDPAEVLAAVGATLRRAPGLEDRVAVADASGVPAVWADADALHHLLVQLALSAGEAEGSGDRGLGVGVESGQAEVVFAVEDRAGPWPRLQGDPERAPRGRDLAAAVAATLTARWDGGVRVLARPGGSRVEVWLPARG